MTRGLALLLSLTLASGCASLGFAHPGNRDWNNAVNDAQASASHGDFETADSILTRFARANPGSKEALETAYWRAVFKLDPSNKSASVQDAMALLDGYLADKRPHQHGVEATTLRRAAGQLDALNKLAANASTQAKDATTTAANAKGAAADAKADAKAAEANAAATADAKDAEIKRLKDELAKATAELDRIRKRLSQPPRE